MAQRSRPAASPAPESPPSRSAHWFDGLDLTLLAALLMLVMAAWCTATAKWKAIDWGVPIAYLEPEKGDMLHMTALIKAAGEGEFVPLTWKQVPQFGAPNDGNWNDWPFVEELQINTLGILSRVFGLFGALNFGVLMAHWLAAVTFYLVARYLGCLRPWAFVGGLAYGLAPFIFAQSPHHVTTFYVWHVPLFLPVWRWVSTEGGMPWRSRRFWCAVGIGFVTGLQSPYFTNILCQITLLGGLALAWRHRSVAMLKPALAVVAAAAAAFFLMNLDTWTYRLANGANQGAVVREYKWLEIYGLKLVDLVIPPVTHHSESFAKFGAEHQAGAPLVAALRDEGPYIGLVGIACLALLAVTTARSVVDRSPSGVPIAAWQVLWIVVTFTTGGLNTILGAFGFTLFRTGSRYSVVILAIALEYAAEWLSTRTRQAEAKGEADTVRIAVLSAVAVVGLVVLWDQVPRAPTGEQMMRIASQVASDQAFATEMESVLPAGAMVFQLPVMDFPESPLPTISSYDHFRPYLYTRTLRYSYGSMKGRPREDWQKVVQQKMFDGATPDQQAQKIRFNIANVNAALDEIQKQGFMGLYINLNGFPDRGKGLLDALGELGFDAPPIRSAGGDLAFVLLAKPMAAGK